MRKWLILGAIIVAVFLLGVLLGDKDVGWQDVIPTGDVHLRVRPSFARDVLPIFQQYCILCHSPADAHNGLRLDSYEGVMKGTQFGAVVVPGKPDLSNLVAVITRQTSPAIWMPYHGKQLSRNRIENIKNWISSGAPNN